MKIYNKIVYDFDNNIIEEDYYEYNGPLTLAEAAGPSGPSGGGGGRAERDKAAKDKAAREEKEMTAEFDRVDKETAERAAKNREDARGDGTSKKKTDFKSVTKEVLNPNNNIQEKKKTPVVTPREGGDNQVTETKLPTTPPIVTGGPSLNISEIPKIAKTAPTEAEVSQSETANADAQALKVKKRGRSRSIMTSAKGVTKTSSDYSLGRPSLLGRV